MQSSSLLNRLYNTIQNKPGLFLYTPLALYWLALFIGTTLPTDKIPQFFNAQDKFEHLLGYFGLAVLIHLWLHFQTRWNMLREKAYLFSFLIVTCYAAFDELHQLFIPGRDCDILDWTADSIGGLAGVLIIYLFIKVSTKNRIPASASS
jgi:VanZ family protein